MGMDKTLTNELLPGFGLPGADIFAELPSDE